MDPATPIATSRQRPHDSYLLCSRILQKVFFAKRTQQVIENKEKREKQATLNPAFGGDRILYIQYTNPAGYPPLQHSSRILADAGWRVLFFGTGAAGSNALEFPPHPNIDVCRMPFCGQGWRQKLHYMKFSFRALWTVLVWRPSWVYASDSLSCPIALLLSWIPGPKVLYHEHDSPPQEANGLFQTIVCHCRRHLARRADLCVLPNAKRLERLRTELGPLRAAACVWNCPGLYEATTGHQKPALSPLWVLYHGSIVPDRLPPSVLDALALLPESVRLRIIGYETIGHPGYVAWLRSRAQSLGVAHRVEFLKPISRWRLLVMTVNADIGLGLIPSRSQDINFGAMTGASNKVFDYLACGLPVIVSDLPDWREAFVTPGYGLTCDPNDARSIAAAIRYLVEHPGQMRAMGEAGRRKILSEWNYETVFAPVFERICRNSTAAATAKQPVETSAVRHSA
jgi:glycosyltransferase involved in cell wall biosynthesis